MEESVKRLLFWTPWILGLAFAVTASAETESKSLKQICDEAKRLVQTPEGVEDADAQYRSVIRLSGYQVSPEIRWSCRVIPDILSV